MIRIYSLIILISSAFFMQAQVSPEVYKIYDSTGAESTWEDMVSECKKKDIIFFGENHSSKMVHWLQLELLKEISTSVDLVLAMEMFEVDQQNIIDEYLSGEISTKAFEEDVRKWNNYISDYKGLVEFAKKNKIPVIASNVPRRYAKKMYEEGEDSLLSYRKNEPDYLPKARLNIDTTLESYKFLMMPMHGSEKKYLLEAQVLKDAMMAQKVCEANKKYGRPVLHINGYYHSDMKEGIISQFSKKCRKKSNLVISYMNVDEFPETLPAEKAKKGDFIIVENKTFYNYYD